MIERDTSSHVGGYAGSYTDASALDEGSNWSVRVGLQTELPGMKNNKAGESRQENAGIDSG